MRVISQHLVFLETVLQQEDLAEYASHLPYYTEYACKVMQISDYEASQMA